MNRKNKLLPYDCDEPDMTFDLDEILSGKRESLIKRFKNKFARDIQRIDYQMKMDMDFWIKYRPSCWLSFIPKRLEKSILQFLDKENAKRLVLYTVFIFCLMFVGFVPTLKFLFWYLFKIWVIFVLIPFGYWGLAIAAIYSRVIVITMVEFIFDILDKLINR